MRRFVETMLIAAAGGALFDLAKFPTGWLAGALVFVAAAALAGRPVQVPLPVARVCFVLLGIVVGGVATPETVTGMRTWPASIAMISVAMIAVTIAAAWYLRTFHRWDTQTAMFAAVPGALSQVSAMASERHSDLRAIIIVQTIRVVVLAVGVPGGLALIGLAAPTRLPTGAFGIAAEPIPFLVLVIASVAAAFGLYRLKFSGGFFFGPMLVSAIMHGSGLVHTNLPPSIANFSMIGLGAINGARFTGTSFRMLVQYMAAALGSLAVVIVVAGVFVAVASVTLSLRAADLVASYAPGSVDVMMILALAMHLDPVFVGAHHLARILVVSIALPIAARLTDRRASEARETLED
ncbi:MAG: AbrB family transcriptional regulator [Xanthobacteraceae bacterium]